jgi:pyruvate kinase
VDSEEKIAELVKSGMSVIRLNCSHGDEKIRTASIQKIRRVEKKLGRPISVMIDLQGPKLRVGVLAKPLVLHSGETWQLTSHEEASEKKKIISLGFSNLAKAVTIGAMIFMDDGLIHARVIKKNAKSVFIKIIHGGVLEARKGMNIPYYKGRLTALNKKDRTDLLWGLKHQVDLIALSFVRKAEDIIQLKHIIAKTKPSYTPLVIAKIEKPEAVTFMDDIIKASDGILIARGDLGIEFLPEKVPVVQKTLIEHCRALKKPVIVATQMLDSMRLNPLPTRAEVSDVASAIYAGTDAVLLTGETSSGKFPIAATQMMAKIITEVEDHLIQKNFRKTPSDFGITDHKDAFVFNAMQLADDIGAKAIVMLTRTGNLTKNLSKLHPKQPIFSLAMNLTAYRQLNLYWGVFPIEMADKAANERIESGIKILKNKKVVKTSDRLLFIYRDFKNENLNLKIVTA